MLGEVAVLPAIYAAAAAAVFAMLAELAIDPRGLAFVVLVAFAVYLLDRVKWRDGWIDPADLEAHPRRQQRLLRHRGGWRLLAAAALLAATVAGWWSGESLATRWLAAVPAAAAFGAFLYGGRPRGSIARPKDLIWLKNLAVAAAIAALAIAATLAFRGEGVTPFEALDALAAPQLALAALAISARVAGDAIWCDLDDADADRHHRTESVPSRLGARAAWTMGLLACLAGAALAVAARPDAFGLTAAGMATIGSIALSLRRPSRVRDLAEARLAIEASVLVVLAWPFG